jgi:tetratricopeptide (TPR) repeat protein
MEHSENTRRTITILVLLATLTLAVFWGLVHCDFTNYDDPYYVTANPHVLGGLTVENVVWAFSTGYYGNWFPLTWLSHMADIELFGLNPAGHHLTSLLFHIANVLLLFGVLQRMTGAAWRSAAVAAFFAVHPLRVESVAWIAERKDVLSSFFFILALWAYVRYVGESRVFVLDSEVRSPLFTAHGPRFAARTTHHASRFYVLSLLFFACGLMSKAMIVTLPCVLLLLDFWPLGRFSVSSPQSTAHHPQPPGPLDALPFTLHAATGLLLEKLPFFGLAAVATAITFSTQQQAGAMGMVMQLSFGGRIANALVSYVKYLGKVAWPSNLAVLYPHHAMPFWEPMAAAVVLLGLSVAALGLARSRPYIPLGWFWFLGTLLPALGLIQVGEQAMADRFTYVPAIGLFILTVWWVSEVAQWRWRAAALGGITALVLTLLAIGTWGQLRYWRTSKALLERDIAVTGGTAVIHNNLGVILGDEGDWPAAERHFVKALQFDPTYARARISLAMGLARQEKTAEAVHQLEGLQPAWNAEGHRMLADTFLDVGKSQEAIQQYLAAARANPTNAVVREKLAMTLARTGRTAEASEQFSDLVRLRPDADTHYHLALSLVILGKAQAAAEHYREAVRLKPDWPEPLNDLAWMLATSPRPEMRNGTMAVRLAERACELTEHKQARCVGTLDAAYAEVGRFSEAITVAKEARKLALAGGDQELADAAAARLELYRSGRAFHQPDQENRRGTNSWTPL